jgi:putative tricarboxylic transport membrane protein
VLAVTSEERLPDLVAPTAREAGVDVVFTNWRGIVAPPGLTEDQVADLRAIVDRMHESAEWREALTRNGWTDAYLTGEAFTAFVREESERVGRVLTDLGLAPEG